VNLQHKRLFQNMFAASDANIEADSITEHDLERGQYLAGGRDKDARSTQIVAKAGDDPNRQ
jgi:hypothetical protein